MKIPKDMQSYYTEELKSIRLSKFILVVFSVIGIIVLGLVVFTFIPFFSLIMIPILIYFSHREYGKLKMMRAFLMFKRFLFEPEYATKYFPELDSGNT